MLIVDGLCKKLVCYNQRLWQELKKGGMIYELLCMER